MNAPPPTGGPLASSVVVFAGDLSLANLAPHRPGSRFGHLTVGAVDRDTRVVRSWRHIAPLLEGAAASIVNLEACFSTLAYSPTEDLKRYLHRDDPEETLPALAAHGFRFVSLGNNHVYDFGAEGLAETTRRLEAAGFQHFGLGATPEAALQPLLLDVPVPQRPPVRFAILSAFEYRDRAGVDSRDYYARTDGVMAHPGVASLGDPDAIRRVIQGLRREDPERVVVLYPHWGEDYCGVTAQQRADARALVAAGADLVIGHGAHQLQSVEVLDGRTAVYGLGNLLFQTTSQYQSTAQFPEALPFSMIARLSVCRHSETLEVALSLRLYPLHCDNLKVDFAPRPVTEATALETLMASPYGLAASEPPLTPRWDGRGRLYVDVPVDLGARRAAHCPSSASVS